MSQILLTGQSVLTQPEYRVLLGGTYLDWDSVSVYVDGYPEQLAAFSAKFIATGENPSLPEEEAQ